MPAQTFEIIPVNTLLARTTALRQSGWRLVQISATRLPDKVELTYSFDRANELANLRFDAPAEGARLPSISPVFWSAFLYENEIHDLFGLPFEGMVIDFQGNLYQTTIKFPFGTTKAPVAKAAEPVPAAKTPANRPAAPQPALVKA